MKVKVGNYYTSISFNIEAVNEINENDCNSITRCNDSNDYEIIAKIFRNSIMQEHKNFILYI